MQKWTSLSKKVTLFTDRLFFFPKPRRTAKNNSRFSQPDHTPRPAIKIALILLGKWKHWFIPSTI